MIFLKNDYGLGAHPRILKALEEDVERIFFVVHA